MLGKVEG